MSEMVERVARAIATTCQEKAMSSGDDFDGEWDWDGEMSEERKDYIRAYAKTAITAMREPTNAMKISGYQTNAAEFNPAFASEEAETIYQAMIDEALK